jgi:hypothetical protein
MTGFDKAELIRIKINIAAIIAKILRSNNLIFFSKFNIKK